MGNWEECPIDINTLTTLTKEYNVKQVITVKTKLDKNDKNPKVTVLTLDFEGCTVEMLAGPAADTLVINKQGAWRRAKAIPAKEDVLVKDMIARMGSRSQAPLTVEGIAAVAGTMKPEEVEALIAKIRADAKARDAAEKGEKKGATKGATKSTKGDGGEDRASA
jgi:hypothetical protein